MQVVDRAQHQTLDRHHKQAGIPYHPISSGVPSHLPPLPSREGSFSVNSPAAETSFSSTHQQPAPEQQVGKMCRGCSRTQRSVGKTKVELVFAALQHAPAACTGTAGG